MLGLVSLSLLISACSAAPNRANPSNQLPNFINQLQQSLRSVDWNNPPFTDGSKLNEYTCPAHAFECTTTDFWQRQTISSLPSHVTVSTEIHTDATLINDGTKDATITSSSSTAVALGTTKGWTIGAKASLSSPDKIGNAELSASYSDTSTSTTTETKTVQYGAVCPAGKTCRIQTVTFQARLEAYCKHEPMLDCRVPVNVCKRPTGILRCQQYVDYYNRNCVSPPSDSPCHVDVQVRADDGKLLTLVIITEE
ncbi:hypothetical protein J3459_017562 [Metarhizium acridum]|uniref:Uncharacterized protein n=1 Tax=Metarhizium acridum (strain CQMa 102) TaxID=655827 RepID=E9EFU7_METAQ|nr:uncharacterized protein MAC_08745 [Metarhizium acridum CQMa 102]EFY85234.1 hypothetical protein MAC_08745 [Metarhizium acridum CQMa 102]KAG8408482.1 hypothetical protein J3458_019518 [Metarhizium acridum]KAG8409385.1 hypothetical protein J3459_017562 [Metarhizium acridum]